MSSKTILIWFRNDLRVRDNEMLYRAIERGDKILPVYCFDPRYYTSTPFGTKKTGIHRARFILESVADLQASFRDLGGELIVRQGLPEQIIPELAAQYQVDEVYHHREVASEETDISARVEEALWKLKLNLRHFIGHTLYHKEDLPFPIRDIPNAFATFKKKTERESTIRPSFDPVDPCDFVAAEQTELPTLADLGFTELEIVDLPDRPFFIGGEREAQQRLQAFVANPSDLDSYLSPWLTQGCISIHEVYFTVVQQKMLPSKQKNEWLLGLWWHDYYRFMFKKHGNRFFQIRGFGSSSAPESINSSEIEQWKRAQTADQSINDIMAKLNATGFISNSERQKAALYLIHRGQDNWLHGAAYFEEKLIDYNPANNYGWWAHLAGVGSSQKHNQVPIK